MSKASEAHIHPGLAPEPPELKTNDEEAAMEAQVSPPPEPPAAWVIAYGALGLINVVADSQEELAARFSKWREKAAFELTSALVPVEVISHNPEAGTSTIWINPLLIQAVLERFVPPRALRPAETGLPPGLEALLAKATRAAASAETTEVVVTEEKPGGEHE